MRPELVSVTEGPVLTVEEVMQNLRIAHDDEHDLLVGLVAAVTSYLDGPSGILRNCLLDQVWAVRERDWRSARLELGNVQSIEAVKYWPADGGAEITLDASSYRIDYDAHGAFLVLMDGRGPELATRADAVTVHFKAGYGESSDSIPAAIRQAMQLLVGHYYKHSEAVITGTRPVELPMGVRSLLAPFRMQRV